MKKIFTLLFSLASFLSFSQSTTVVISQVYGGGGGSSGTYLHDYVELHNISNVTQDISGFQLMYGSATGQFGSSAGNIYTFPAGTTIPAGGYLLIQTSAAGSAGAALPVTPDYTTTNLTMSGTSGKLALVTPTFTGNTCGATATPCTLPNANIIDLVAWGTANNAEGGASVNNGVALTSTQGAVRKSSGCKETNNNNTDFEVVTGPVPKNSASTAVNCAPLPLQLTSFNATLSDNKVNVEWTASNEVNVAGYDIERSVNGKDFMPISMVAAANTGSTKQYAYTDPRAVSGVSYYRLKMKDSDGSFKYSQIATVKTSIIGVSLYPNPVKSAVTVQHEGAVKGATISIVGMSGKQLISLNVQAGAVQTTIEAAKLAPGAYMVIFTNNGVKQTKQFIKE
jgi:hypothetical protein